MRPGMNLTRPVPGSGAHPDEPLTARAPGTCSWLSRLGAAADSSPVLARVKGGVGAPR